MEKLCEKVKAGNPQKWTGYARRILDGNAKICPCQEEKCPLQTDFLPELWEKAMGFPPLQRRGECGKIGAN